MANTKSALKRVRTSGRRQVRNRAIRSATRTSIKKAHLVIEAGKSAESRAAVQQAISALDRATTKGVLHRNNAARRKSRLCKLLQSMAG